MRKKLSLFLSIVLIFSVFSCFRASAAGENVTVKLNVRYGQTQARSMLSMINSFRTGSDAWYWNNDNKTKTVCTNLGTLEYDYELEKIAMQRAAEIAVYWSHTRPNGQLCFSLISGRRAYGENLAAGSSNALDAFTLLQETDRNYEGQGHRRNMLDNEYTAVGIGHVIYNGVHYWTQEFGNPKSSQSYSEPDDGEALVPVSVNSSIITDYSVKAESEKITVHSGLEAEIPSLSLRLGINGQWPSGACDVLYDADFSVADSSVAEIRNGKIHGLKEGKTELVSSFCENQLKLSLIVTGHELVTDNEVFATCTSKGLTEGSHCRVCGEIIVPQTETEKVDHKYTQTDIVTSCTEEGRITYTCSVCGDIKYETVKPINHANAYGTKGVSATCTEDGFTGGRYCPDCKTYLSGHEVIKAEGHKPSVYSEMVPPTCESEGYTAVVRCTVCDEIVRRGEVIEKLPHSFTEYFYNNDATCFKDGTKTARCVKCGFTDTITAEGTANHCFRDYHFSEETGCEEDRIMIARCLYCDATDSFTVENSKPGHEYKTVTEKATLLKNGSVKTVCSRCGDVKSEKTIAFPKTISLSASSFVYNGKIQKPVLTVKGSDSKTISSSDYSVSYSDASSKNSGSYTVKITFKGNYEGSKTFTYKITPAQATGLKASVSAASIKLLWNKTAGAKYYRVEKSTDGKKWTAVAVTDKTSYTVTKLAAGTKYQLRVTALDSSKKVSGKVSSSLKTATLTKAPAISLKSAKSKTACVTWKKVAGASKYIVYKSTDSKKWVKAGETSKLTFTLTKLTGGKKIYVRVTAVNAYSKESSPSSAKTVTVKK